MKHWTKAEQNSARAVINLTYTMGKVKMECKPLRIKLADMETKDFNTFAKLLEKYGRKSKNPQPVMKIMK